MRVQLQHGSDAADAAAADHAATIVAAERPFAATVHRHSAATVRRHTWPCARVPIVATVDWGCICCPASWARGPKCVSASSLLRYACLTLWSVTCVRQNQG